MCCISTSVAHHQQHVLHQYISSTSPAACAASVHQWHITSSMCCISTSAAHHQQYCISTSVAQHQQHVLHQYISSTSPAACAASVHQWHITSSMCCISTSVHQQHITSSIYCISTSVAHHQQHVLQEKIQFPSSNRQRD